MEKVNKIHVVETLIHFDNGVNLALIPLNLVRILAFGDQRVG